MSSTIMLLRKNRHLYKDLPTQYTCAICRELLLVTYQTPCGCRACKTCGENYFAIGKPCPSGELECDNYVQKSDLRTDRAADKEIMQLTVTCMFKPCTLQFKAQELENHLTICEYRLILCGQCKEEVTMRELDEHKNSTCEGRLTKCQYCDEEKTIRELQSYHYNIDSEQLCELFCGVCPNNCGQQEPIRLKEHLYTCPMRKIECPYPECRQSPMNLETLREHFREREKEHVESQMKQSQKRTDQISELQQQMETMRNILDEILVITNTSSKTLLTLERKYGELTTKVSTPVVNPTIQPRVSTNTNPYIWRITDYESKLERAKHHGEVSILSEPFYTRTYGYKLRVKVYPDGDGAGKGTHMSIYFAIMKSEYDLLQQWPFNRQVTFTMLYSGGTPGHQQVFKNGEGVGYDRPVDESNTGLGAPTFVTQANLRNNYLREDSIFIRISVND